MGDVTVNRVSIQFLACFVILVFPSASLVVANSQHGFSSSPQAARPPRKLPRQADHSTGDCSACSADEGLGRKVSGGTRPRLS